MRSLTLAVLSLCISSCAEGQIQIDGGTERTFRFANKDAGRLPPSWKAEKTGKGDGSLWKVVADETAPSKSGHVLAQTAKGPRRLFNLCVVEDTAFSDVSMSVAFKAIRGKIDQGGGLVWRYQDANNYYICRFNPLENNLRIYTVVAGTRRQLASADLDIPAGQWNRLRVVMKGELIVCSVAGLDLDVRDDTIKGAGKIGLWTKADAETYFDDLRVRGTK